MQHANWDAIIALVFWVAGNVALVLFAACDAALIGNAECMAECVEAINAAEAMDD